MEHQYSSQQQEKVGITEYITSGRQVLAITKYLLSDFIVNEIDKNKELVYLKTKPSEHKENPKVEISFQVSEEFKRELKQALGEETAASIEKLYNQLDCQEKVGPWEFVIERQLTKAQRLAIHTFVRERLYQIESTAVDGGKIRLRFNRNLRKMNPNARQKYTYFKLYKNGVDTFNAIFRLSKITGVSNKLFSTAGLKDKRGHTTQMVSVYNTDTDTLKKFYKQAYRNQQMWIDDFEECKDNKIEIGGLFGNQFGLVLRLINPSDAAILAERVDKLRDIGMINYFGLQRFGQFSIKTYQLGAMVVRKQWKQLIQSILLSDCGNFGANNLKRELYESKQYFKAEKLLHNKYKIQKLIFKGLSKQGENYMSIFQTLPRSIKSLYTHALQSYIWNKIVSRRVKQAGLKVVLGDIVGIRIVSENEATIEKRQQQDQDLIVKQDDVQDDQQVEIALITEENISKYTIHDLVAPLYGPNSTIPHQSILYPYIQEELNLLGLKDQDFLQNSKLLCFKGQFRKIISKPEKVGLEIVNHQSPKAELLSPFYTKGDQVVYEKGPLSSARLILQLPKSSYATMAIRQLLHVSSQFEVQMDLNRQYERINGIERYSHKQNVEEKQ